MSRSRKDRIGGHYSREIASAKGGYGSVSWGLKGRRFAKHWRSKMMRRHERVSIRDLEVIEPFDPWDDMAEFYADQYGYEDERYDDTWDDEPYAFGFDRDYYDAPYDAGYDYDDYDDFGYDDYLYDTYVPSAEEAEASNMRRTIYRLRADNQDGDLNLALQQLCELDDADILKLGRAFGITEYG